MVVVAYIAAIVVANVVTAAGPPPSIGPFIVPWGTWFIGLTLLLRDFVQLRHGRGFSYVAIALALVASALSSHALGDTLWITGASAVAFAVSESMETEIFTRLRAFLAKRIFWSGTFSSLADSVVFIILGLSPLTTGFVPWPAIPFAILGQYIVKTAMISLGASASAALRGRLAPTAA